MVQFGTMKAGLGAAVAVVVALSAGAGAADIRDLTGSVAYREKIALPQGALVEVRLLDVSKMDVAATLLASQTLRPAGQVPVDYRLSYDDGMVLDSGRYAVSALIRVGDQVLWRSTTVHPALTRGAPAQVDIMLEKMVESQSGALSGSNWRVVELASRSVQSEKPPELRFGTDGRVSGTSGCNQFTGSYTQSGEVLSFGNMAVTRMACIGNLGAQETAFFDALSKVSGVGLRAGQTVLVDHDGAVVMQLAAP
ncbi:YbaY family lipoprotein [Shimia sp.]|uniref:YbaY family lipoprotein n=1 Tax=Shimia sp. TaxID=1954381 RepID=UPI003B8E44CE